MTKEMRFRFTVRAIKPKSNNPNIKVTICKVVVQVSGTWVRDELRKDIAKAMRKQFLYIEHKNELKWNKKKNKYEIPSDNHTPVTIPMHYSTCDICEKNQIREQNKRRKNRVRNGRK